MLCRESKWNVKVAMWAGGQNDEWYEWKKYDKLRYESKKKKVCCPLRPIRIVLNQSQIDTNRLIIPKCRLIKMDEGM
jgi:hypothetical protein